MTSATRSTVSSGSAGTARLALLSLAIGSFGIGMTEFVVMGLLPQISADLLPALSATDPDAAIAQSGWLISLYALGVVVGAPTIAASVAKYPRHRVMLALAAALALFNALTVVMPTFELVAVSRFLSGLPHGAYFGIGALVASDVLGPGTRGGFFAAYSYIASIVTAVAGSPAWVVPIVLVVMGVGMTIGNLLGGRLADRDLRRTLLWGLGVLAIVQVLLALTCGWIVTLVVFVFAVGVVSSVLSPSIQTRLMDVAGDNQSIAAALNHSALNIGNATGAALGGAVIAAGFGFVAPVWVGAALAAAGLVIALASFRADARRPAAVLA